ncbi:MAG: urea transporter [Alphaproteobacteria bacterium]|nr:urea transporter [Alphaproteobacteria bacterium]
MVGASKYLAKSTLNGLGQIVFSDRPVSGLLVLAGFVSIAPWAAVGALAGALLGALASGVLKTWNRVETSYGLAGANLAIVGASFAFVAPQAARPLTMIIAIIVCIGVEAAARRLLQPLGLPALSFPAVAALLLLTGLHGAFGQPFWAEAGKLPADVITIAIPVALFASAAAIKSWHATALAGVLTAAAALASGYILNDGWLGPIGLWAFAVTPAVFGVYAIFLAGSRIGAYCGIAAAALAAAIWAGWMASPLAVSLPPLLVPFILATWITLGAVRFFAGPTMLDPHVWAAVEEIRRAKSIGRPALALTGAGISTASGIPDYASGAWLDPDIPISTYAHERFLESKRCRQLYWDACGRFREVAAAAAPNIGHHALAAMERKGWLGATVTQNVDRLHQAAGADNVIELHGRIDRVRCIGCGEPSDWPPAGLWGKFDLACQACGGLLKPAVIAMGENVPARAWESAEAAAMSCGVVLVIGSQMAISSAAALLARARAHGAKVIFLNFGDAAAPMLPGDLVLNLRAEDALPAIARLLGCHHAAPQRVASASELPSTKAVAHVAG